MLPDLGLGALLEHDQGAPGDRGAVLVERQLDPDRLGEPDPGGDVDEDAVAPAGVVAGDERVVGRHQRAEPALDQLRVGLDRLGQRQHRRALGALDRGVGGAGLVGVEVEP